MSRGFFHATEAHTVAIAGSREPTASLAVIIVNFRTPTLTIECLYSLVPEAAADTRLRIYVIDNGSGDDSATRIRSAIDDNGWAAWCHLEISAVNRGFAGGCNDGVAAAVRDGGAEFVLLLNSDTIVHTGCLAECLTRMRDEPTIGALSCRVLNSDGTNQNVCRRFPTPARCIAASFSLPWRFPALFEWADCEDAAWDRTSIQRDVDWIGGAFMMLRGDWLARHGGLDERFFFYGEDVEICHRVWGSGFRCHYAPVTTIVHLGGASSDPSRMTNDHRRLQTWRSRYLIQEICYGASARWSVQAADLIAVAARLIWRKLRGKAHSADVGALSEVGRLLISNWRHWEKPISNGPVRAR